MSRWTNGLAVIIFIAVGITRFAGSTSPGIPGMYCSFISAQCPSEPLITICKENIGEIISAHIAPKYLDNIVEIFLGNIVRLLKYFETYH